MKKNTTKGVGCCGGFYIVDLSPPSSVAPRRRSPGRSVFYRRHWAAFVNCSPSPARLTAPLLLLLSFISVVHQYKILSTVPRRMRMRMRCLVSSTTAVLVPGTSQACTRTNVPFSNAWELNFPVPACQPGLPQGSRIDVNGTRQRHRRTYLKATLLIHYIPVLSFWCT